VIFCDLQQVCDDGVSNGYYSCQLKDFWDRFEELQTSNLQKPEESLQETNECCPIETAEAAWNMSEVNETPNPVDLEKIEINKVDKALNCLKLGLSWETREQRLAWFDLTVERLFAREEQDAKIKKEYKRLQKEYRDNMSKPEPKIDMKEKRMSKIEIGSQWQSIDGYVVSVDFAKNDFALVVWTYKHEDQRLGEITLATRKEDFIKDFKKIIS
jgi:hypothetical protein